MCDAVQENFLWKLVGIKPKSGRKNVAILDLSDAISRKRCKIGGKLLLITNRKSHMGFRLVPNSMTAVMESMYHQDL